MVTPFAEGALLRTVHRAVPVDIDTLTGGGNVLVLAPHPDDESLGCGAAIAAASESGAKVVVVAVTDGGRSHPRSALYPPARLAALRFAELEHAVGVLTQERGVAVSLGYPDQDAPSTEDDIAAACRHLCAIVDDLKPSAVWATWKGDPHIDHQRTARIAACLVRAAPALTLFSYPVWGRFTETPVADGETLCRFDASAFQAVKEEAVLCHRSQMTALIPDDPQGFVMDEATQWHFIDSPELFIGKNLDEKLGEDLP